MSLQDEIRKEISTLKQNLIKIDRAIDSAPSGTLRLSPGKNDKTYFYIQHADGQGNTQYEYLSTRDRRKIAALAQKNYYKKLRNVIVEECDRLEVFLKSYDPDAKHRVYSLLSPARQELVRPMYVSVDDTVNKWRSEHYLRYTDHPEQLRYVTDRGDRVRNSSDAALANLFHSHRHRLLYRYEAALSEQGGRACFPTFTLLRLADGQKYYWEHVILNGGPQRMDEFIQKLSVYYRLGIYPGENLIVTFESPGMPLDLHNVRLLLRHYFAYRF